MPLNESIDGANDADEMALPRLGQLKQADGALSRFGEQRRNRGVFERIYYGAVGVPDPAHYLHHRYLARALAEHGPIEPKQILDAGCGAGDHSIWLARRYPAALVTGIDLNPSSVAWANQAAQTLGLANVSFETRDILSVDQLDSYDLIVSIDVLEHIRDQTVALARLRSALRPGGIAFFHIPTKRPVPVPFSKHLTEFHAWAEHEHVAEEQTAVTFERAVNATGLTVITCYRTFGRWTGELATSLFAIPWQNNWLTRVAQGVLGPLCKGLTFLDPLMLDATRYAVGVVARKPLNG